MPGSLVDLARFLLLARSMPELARSTVSTVSQQLFLLAGNVPTFFCNRVLTDSWIFEIMKDGAEFQMRMIIIGQ